MNQVIEQMKNRRSVRGFSGESVKDEVDCQHFLGQFL